MMLILGLVNAHLGIIWLLKSIKQDQGIVYGSITVS
jgi:hypothetical protein